MAESLGTTQEQKPRTKRHSLELRLCTGRDQDALLDLHHRCFAGAWSAADWRWRYREHPLGVLCAVGAFAPDGRCAAAYCGVPQRFLFAGEEGLALHASDIAVEPPLRRGLAGARIMIDLTRLFYARHARGPVRLVYGFPEPALRRLQITTNRGEILWDTHLLVRDVAAPVTGTHGLQTDGVRSLGDGIESLWQDCRQHIRSGVVRDRRHLEWRYGNHPSRAYVFVEAREPGTNHLRGLAVLRDEALHPNTLALVELLTRYRDREAETALLKHAQETARILHRSHLVAWLPPTRSIFHRFQTEYGFTVRLAPYQLCIKSFHRSATGTALFPDWWVSLGDMDFA